MRMQTLGTEASELVQIVDDGLSLATLRDPGFGTSRYLVYEDFEAEPTDLLIPYLRRQVVKLPRSRHGEGEREDTSVGHCPGLVEERASKAINQPCLAGLSWHILADPRSVLLLCCSPVR